MNWADLLSTAAERVAHSTTYRSREIRRRIAFRAQASDLASRAVGHYATDLDSRGRTRPLIIFTDVRTGSSLLNNYLGQLERVTAVYEILNHGQYRELRGCRRPTDVRFYLNRLLDASPEGWLAFNVHSSHLRYRRMTASTLLSAYPESVAVQLYRNDLLAQLVSFKLAKTTGTWDLRGEDSGKGAAPTLAISPDEFRRFRSERVTWIETCANLVADWPHGILLEYEHVARDPEAAVSYIARTIGVPLPITLEERLHKQEQTGLDRRVENYSQLVDEIGAERYYRR